MKIIYETLSVSTYLLEKIMNESRRARGEIAMASTTSVLLLYFQKEFRPDYDVKEPVHMPAFTLSP